MVVAMHQPQYLPWLGYFHKIDKSDIFVILDNVQYEKGGFQNRNKIRVRDGSMWLTVPVLTRGQSRQAIREVRVDNSKSWQRQHEGSLMANYKEARFFLELEEFFSNLYSMRWESLLDLNIEIIKYIMGYLGIKKNMCLESELGIGSTKTDRIIDICKKFDADTYLSGAGAKEYLEEEKFSINNIKLTYQRFRHPEYSQAFVPFFPNLSIVDLLFNHGREGLNILRS